MYVNKILLAIKFKVMQKHLFFSGVIRTFVKNIKTLLIKNFKCGCLIFIFVANKILFTYIKQKI